MSIQVEKIGNENWFKVEDVNQMRPFFMNIVSDSNHWMFISSNGGLSAGRKNSDYSLFPYYTDDKLTDLAHTTGSKTLLRVKNSQGEVIWEPLSVRSEESYSITRNLYKNLYGNKLMFEEINHDLNLTYTYQWNSSNGFGFVKKATLVNHADETRSITVLDGLQNILPASVDPDLQTRASNLVDAYKRSELLPESGLGIFALSAIIVDKAEPSEALKANVVWSTGLEASSYLLSTDQLDSFRKGRALSQETDIKGERGAYFVESSFTLNPNDKTSWSIIANVNQDHSGVVDLNERILKQDDLQDEIDADIERGSEKLVQLIGGADGLQKTADLLKDSRHFSNTLFNIMRGGIFDDNYTIEKSDFTSYLKQANSKLFSESSEFLASLEPVFDRYILHDRVEQTNNPDLIRLAKEYLPLKFSRRHGDPSRPWNQFSINTHSEVDGSKILDYEGNWRDIFQNWEALVHSYPDFIEGMIFKFLNASTFDGYNPYRVTKDGFDWETIDPDDPWSYIGYWGDHQIIYLLKFLEFYHDYKPDEFVDLFEEDLFVYAHVPYCLKSYDDIKANPKDTIEFDGEADAYLNEQMDTIGADGALLKNQSGSVHHVNFIEKILATTLAKLSNFVPEGGIWMNTQRPEWNDANNALVGNGVSMVTLYYLRRFLTFFSPILKDSSDSSIEVSEEVAAFFQQTLSVLNEYHSTLEGDIDNSTRQAITDALGQSASTFRNSIYKNGFTGNKKPISLAMVQDLADVANQYMEHAIRANKRDDDLYHAYNLLEFNDSGLEISYLDEMLEGQVAALSSGYLTPEQSVDLLDALRQSSLYREDQNSYILYPNKQLPGFMEKNNLPKEDVESSELLMRLLEDGNPRIIKKDRLGNYHFHGNFKNANDLKAALDELMGSGYDHLIEKERGDLLALFENVFNHKAFTGRSGTFFGYEGLGSIYWHMVSKLWLAAYEICKDAHENDADSETMSKLIHHFREIGEGIGVHKSPELYGSFPTDAYSHTPYHKGAQQPGMTGQVKEDILVRFGVLGIDIKNDSLGFIPFLLSKSEFSSEPATYHIVDVDKNKQALSLEKETLGFTCCQIPVIYKVSDKDQILVNYSDGSNETISGQRLHQKASRDIFSRSGKISSLHVELKEDHLQPEYSKE